MKRYIGIDLGGTAIKGGVFSREGECICTMEVPTLVERGFEPIAEDIARMVFQLAAENEKSEPGHVTSIENKAVGAFSRESLKNICSVGIGIPGIADGVGFVKFCTNLAWTGVPLGERLRGYLGIPVFVDNDATVAGYAESVFGVTKGAKNSVFITLGTGIGGGIIVNNHIYSGSNGAGSEIGHMMIGDNFYNCSCGRNGCFETFASATALLKYAEFRLSEKKDDSSLVAIWKSGQLTAKVIFDEAKKGDRLANEVVDRLAYYLAKGILNLYDILDPEIIALGGGLSKAGDFLLERVRTKLQGNTLVKSIQYGDIVMAKLGNDAGIVGAAMLGLNYL